MAPPARAVWARGRIEYRAVLSGQVFPEGSFRKGHLVLLISGDDGQSMDVDFPLKSRFGYDAARAVGNVLALKER